MFNSCGSSAGSSLHLYSKLYHIDLSCFEPMDYFGFFFLFRKVNGRMETKQNYAEKNKNLVNS